MSCAAAPYSAGYSVHERIGGRPRPLALEKYVFVSPVSPGVPSPACHICPLPGLRSLLSRPFSAVASFRPPPLGPGVLRLLRSAKGSSAAPLGPGVLRRPALWPVRPLGHGRAERASFGSRRRLAAFLQDSLDLGSKERRHQVLRGEHGVSPSPREPQRHPTPLQEPVLPSAPHRLYRRNLKIPRNNSKVLLLSDRNGSWCNDQLYNASTTEQQKWRII
ncbi:uncharacterized protein LOC125047142 [Penaeus chinensis]|uniref:uncharacterized protein LOC125047142 n=1 Tax=Penaeus chinensis TaxID=139456 RepID=UPI001FB8184D|nr:uncharacterized protein LOC125047142 [Penaeus chinensis]